MFPFSASTELNVSFSCHLRLFKELKELEYKNKTVHNSNVLAVLKMNDNPLILGAYKRFLLAHVVLTAIVTSFFEHI